MGTGREQLRPPQIPNRDPVRDGLCLNPRARADRNWHLGQPGKLLEGVGSEDIEPEKLGCGVGRVTAGSRNSGGDCRGALKLQRGRAVVRAWAGPGVRGRMLGPKPTPLWLCP